MTPAVSIVMPTYNRWGQLEAALAGLAGQSVPQDELEIIVVSDGSTDGTDAHLRAGRAPVDVVFLEQANSGPAVARNAGVAAATAELVLFIDDDVVAQPGCVAAHLRSHERAAGPTVVIGPLLTPTDGHLDPWVEWEQYTLDQQYEAMRRGDWAPTARQFYTGNASLSRSEIVAAGGFDPAFRRAEDVELAYRLAKRGMSFDFEFDAKAYHYASRSYESWLSNAKAYGRNDAVMWRDGGEDWLLSALSSEYRERNRLVRAHTTIGLRVPALQRLGEVVAPKLAPPLVKSGMGGLARRGLSAVYNLAYYRSLLDELDHKSARVLVEHRP